MSTCLSIYLSVCWYVCLPIYPPAHPCMYVSIKYIYLSIYLSTCVSISVSISFTRSVSFCSVVSSFLSPTLSSSLLSLFSVLCNDSSPFSSHHHHHHISLLSPIPHFLIAWRRSSIRPFCNPTTCCDWKLSVVIMSHSFACLFVCFSCPLCRHHYVPKHTRSRFEREPKAI